MKILFISNMYPSEEKPYAGIFIKNQFERISALLKSSDEEIAIFYMKRKFTNPIGTYFKYFVLFIRFIPLLFRRYDIVHVHFFHPLIFMGVLYKLCHPKSKLFTTFYGKDITTKFQRGLSKSIFTFLAKKVDFTITVGTKLKTLVEERLRLKVNAILPTGADERVFTTLNLSKVFDFIFVGSLIDRKGIDQLIDAIHKFESRGLKFNYCFIGTGKYAKDLKNLKDLGCSIRLYEGLNQKDISRLLNESKFMIFPTRNEGYPNASMEALFCGTPVLSSNIEQMKEQIVDKFNGLLFEVDNIDDMMNTMEKAYQLDEEEYQMMSKNAHISLLDLSLSSISDRLYKIYLEII